jgi:hypothetical protein
MKKLEQPEASRRLHAMRTRTRIGGLKGSRPYCNGGLKGSRPYYDYY